jgi:hypothetical protein
MGHFAKVSNGVVTQVIVAEPEFFQNFVDSSPGEWIQTSYNTHGGQHPEGRPLRKNYAGIGFTYDSVRDAFIPPQPRTLLLPTLNVLLPILLKVSCLFNTILVSLPTLCRRETACLSRSTPATSLLSGQLFPLLLKV